MVDFQLKMAMFHLRRNKRERFRLYRKLQGMLDMNEPLPRALERLWLNYSENGKRPDRPMALIMKHWLAYIRQGRSLSECARGSVPEGDAMLIRAGEEAGDVGAALHGIMVIEGSTKRMKAAITNAVAYPAFMMILLGCMLWLFGVKMVQPMREYAPKNVVDQLGLLGTVSDLIQSKGILFIFIIIAIVILISLTLPVWRGGLRAKFDMFPPWQWYRIWQGAAFLLGLSALLKSQVALKKALDILAEGASPWLSERLVSARSEILRGRNLGESLRAGNLNFPDPQIALDLEILAERSDVSKVLEMVTQDWLDEQSEMLEVQSNLVKTIGLGVVGGVIAWSMMSVIRITQSISSG